MARLTGLEPATPGVTGRYSNQLSYNRATYVRGGRAVARLTGLEPATPGVTGRYSNQLSYNRTSAARARPNVGVYYAPPTAASSGRGGFYRSGAGMNSASSPGGRRKRPCAQSPARHASRAASIRSLLEATKFHQIWRGPSIVAPPSNMIRVP